MEVLLAVIGGGCGAAIVNGIFALIQHFLSRKDKKGEKESVQNKSLRYIMLYIIQERAKQYIAAGRITLEERRSLNQWHDLYHNGLGGNGDATALMNAVNKLPLSFEGEI